MPLRRYQSAAGGSYQLCYRLKEGRRSSHRDAWKDVISSIIASFLDLSMMGIVVVRDKVACETNGLAPATRMFVVVFRSSRETEYQQKLAFELCFVLSFKFCFTVLGATSRGKEF